MSESESNKPTSSKSENSLYCRVCDVSLPDASVLESHYMGKKHAKKMREVDLQERQEGKAVFLTNLGSLKLPEILEYMSTFGVVVNLTPSKNNKHPDLLHHVIVEYESEEIVSRILSRQNRGKHKVEIPGSSPPRFQAISIYERKFQQRKRSPSPPPCPEVSPEQVIMRLNLVFDCEEQLEELSRMLNIDVADVQARIDICRNMERTFSTNPQFRCAVYPFGSSINGLGFPGCDLDIYLDLAPVGAGAGAALSEVPVQISEQQKVRIARRVLSSIKQISRMTAILSARVPILKFIHRPTGIHCDISFKNRMSVLNTEYIRLCLATDPRVRPVLMAVRFWAKYYGLAGGGGGMKMSSYALTILVITFLQHLDQPVLHSVLELQAVPGLEPDLINGWNCNFTRDLTHLRTLPLNPATQMELLAGFFQFISSLELSSVVLCPLLGKVLTKCSLSTSYPEHISTSTFLKDQEGLQLDRPLCLQDPFELSHNVCRNLPEKAVKRFVMFCREAASLAQNCLSAELRPSGGLCSLLKIEIPEIEEVSNTNTWLGQLSEERAELFSHSFKISVPSNYLDWFNTESLGITECPIIACVQQLLDVCLGDCLKFTKAHPDAPPDPPSQSETEEHGVRISEKRPGGETDQDEVPVKKKRTELRYEEGSCWSVWDLVWVRRRQELELIDKTNKTTVEVEAAVTEAVTKDCIRLSDPEAEFRLHFLASSSDKNTLLLGLEKLKSRKKSFESIVSWMKSYIPNVVKMIVQDKLQEIPTLKEDSTC